MDLRASLKNNLKNKWVRAGIALFSIVAFFSLIHFATESNRRENQALIDQALKAERIQSAEKNAMSLAIAVNREVESLYYQGIARIRTGEAIPEGSALLHVAEWGWNKNPSDLKILMDSSQPGLDGNWTTNYLDRLGDEIVAWRGIMGSETQSLTWKSPDEKETFFTWVVPSGSAERKVRTILVKTSALESLKNQKDTYLISKAGVLLSLPHTNENLTKAERLYRLTQRLSQTPNSHTPFMSSTENGSEMIVSIQPIPAIGAELAFESAWNPGVVKAKTQSSQPEFYALIALFVFTFLFWFVGRRKNSTHSSEERFSIFTAPNMTPAQEKLAKAKAALDQAVVEATEKAAALKASSAKSESPITTQSAMLSPMANAPVMESVKPAPKEAMDTMARETLKGIEEAVSDFDWSKLSQEITQAALKPVDLKPGSDLPNP